jgi:protein-S-isoprenylcysteine O-methyltransferase Ste14
VGPWRHARAIVLCPGTVVLAVPALITWRSWPANVGWGLPGPLAVLPTLLGAGLTATGLALVGWTVSLFATEGRGTLAPWDPTTRLVVEGPYRHVRNPMISGVLFILLGEAVLFGSLGLLAWFAVVFAVNALYFPLVEEPGLESRFGEEYRTYRAHVRRWLPRLRPWQPER